MKPLLETINTRFGTANKHAFSRGNTLPYTGVPFGMNYFVPQTSDQEGAWFFDPHLPIFQGIRLTHQPSPWIGDYSWLLLTPVTGQLGGDSLFHRQSSYDIEKASFQPHYLRIFSLRYQIEIQLTPTCYGASIRLEQKQGKDLSLYLHAADDLTVEQVDKRTLGLRQEGKTETNKNPLKLFTALQMNSDILAVSQEGGDWRIDLTDSHAEIQLATSFISPSQALLNLPQTDFDSCKASAQEDWENLLHRFDIVETGEADRTFFDHCLYRLFLFPQTFYEVDESGQAIHMDLATGTVKPGVLFSNNGFWDTFRTTFPLFALIIPEHYHRFLEGFLNSYRDTGFLPKWLAPDERGMMPGTLLDGIIADSACKDMTPDLEEEFLQAMLETATESDPLGINGRHGLAQYQELQAGYHVGVGMRSHCGTNHIVCVRRMAAPVAYGFVGSIFQGHVARSHGFHSGSQHLHALYVYPLPFHIGLSHVDHAFHSHQGAYRSCGHSVLSGSCFGDDAFLAHSPGQKHLADGIVDFVRSRMVQVLPFQVNFASVFFRQALGKIKW